VNLSGTSITSITLSQHRSTSVKPVGWPPLLVDLRINDCEKLANLPTEFPPKLRRFEMRNVVTLRRLSKFPKTLDYIDLRNSTSIGGLPDLPKTTRTLFLHGASLNLPFEVYGENEENVVEKVRSHQQAVAADKEAGLSPVYDHDVKVILLGNGRCGKTSLAKALKGEEFDEHESSTHGVQLWSVPMAFAPIDGAIGVTSETATLNIWDFAGQDLYHNTHRIFFQSKAVFVICETELSFKGSDPESDKTELQKSTQFEEVDRDRQYWVDQVRSFSHRIASQEAPPIIFVHTKCDRKPSNRPDVINFSASTKEGLDKLITRLQQDVAKVLGKEGERELGSGRAEVKRILQSRKKSFDEELRLNEKDKSREIKKRAYMKRETFDKLVKRYSNSKSDQRNPFNFLDRLHESGFLFYSEKFLKDYVILDQRWAIKGIYTLFDREIGWPALEDAKGNFSRSDLREWAWDREGYSLEQQEMLLEFMKDCGICFEIMDASESIRGEEIFTAPAAWPKKSEQQTVSNSLREGCTQNGETVELTNELLGRDAAVQLLVRLGRTFRNDPIYWRWGGQFRSRFGDRWASEPTYIYIDWSQKNVEGFGGTLSLTLYGPETTLLRAVLAEANEVAGFEVVEKTIELSQESIRSKIEVYKSADTAGLHDTVRHKLENIERPDLIRTDGTNVEDHARVVEFPITVAISHAGDPKAKLLELSDIPDDSIEKWPKLLIEALKRAKIKFVEYREDEKHPYSKRTRSSSVLINKIAKQDYVVIILSRKYLFSQPCMSEFTQVRQLIADHKMKEEQMRLGCLPCGQILSPDSLDDKQNATSNEAGNCGKKRLSLKDFTDHWNEETKRHNEYLTSLKENHFSDDMVEFLAFMESFRFDPKHMLFRTISADKSELLKIYTFLYSHKKESLANAPSLTQANEIIEDIRRSVDDPTVQFAVAKKKWSEIRKSKNENEKNALKQDAISLYLSATRKQKKLTSDKELSEFLQRLIHDSNALNEIREAAIATLVNC
jgi:GTPase SAR1 family protein